jgi:16S rRNA G966 N2-methylase RsmD
MENIEKLPEEIFKNQYIKENTLVIIEHSVRNDLSSFPYFIKQRKYGKVSFSFFSKEKAQI